MFVININEPNTQAAAGEAKNNDTQTTCFFRFTNPNRLKTILTYI